MIYTLEKCEMLKLLSDKQSAAKDNYISVLKVIEESVGDLLEFTKNKFPNYTDHTIRHSFRILRYISCILDEKMKENLSATEIFCLIASAMLHDIGMSDSTNSDTNIIRQEHADLSGKYVHKFFEQIKLMTNFTRLANCIAYVCESHTKKLQYLYEESELKKKDTINGEVVRYGYLTILLRIGDLLDMEEERTSYMVSIIFPEYYQREGSYEKHHKRCEELKTFNYSDKIIEAVVETIDRVNYKLWSNWFLYLKEEIVYANTYYFREFVDGASLPKFEYQIEIAQGANFSTEEIRFEIDDKGALWKLISNSIYTAEYDFVRELVQNAIDACLLDCYLNTENILEDAFQRKWPLSQYCVNILFSRKRNQLIVQDNGVGMDLHTLNKYLFKTADSGYRHISVERDFLFPAIAKFGIGFVACLTKADKIKVYTQEKHDNEMIVVEIEKDNNLAFIEHYEKTPYHGTAVELILKDDCTYAGIERYLKTNFYAQAVKVEFINLDVLEEISSIHRDFQEFDLKKVYEYTNCVENYMKKFKVLLDKTYDIRKIVHEIDALREFLQTVNADDIIPLDVVEKQHKSIVSELKEYSSYINRDVMLRLASFTPDTIDIKHQEYEKLLSEIIMQLNQFQKDNYEVDIKIGRNLITTIGDTRWTTLMNEDICIVYLDRNFLVEDVQYQIDIKRIESSMGIIFIKTEYVESSLGIEYSAINPFFFREGTLTAYLLKVKGNKFELTNYDENHIISLDEIYDLQYQLKLEFETEEEEESYHRQIRQLEAERYSYKIDVLFGNETIKILRNVDSSTTEKLEWNQGITFPSETDYQRKYIGELVPSFESSLFCQDGIKIEVDMSSLIPFGVNYCSCNLFADARMELNVTRHDINRDSLLINKWMEKYGEKIQEKVIENIKKTMDMCKLNYTDIREYVQKKGDGIFETCSYNHFIKLLDRT